MRFTQIRYDGETVGLRWEDTIAGAVDKHEWSCDEPPTPAFRASLAAFSSFVVDLIDAPAGWSEGLEIRQLALKEEDSGARGIVVTALRKCDKAKGRTLLVNSPYMAEAPDEYNGDGKGYLSDTILELIEDAEEQAALYRGGDRGEQTQLDLPSENTKNVNDRMAAAEVASTRKPRRGKPKDFVPNADGAGQVVNADATELITDASLRQLLLSVERDVPVDAIARFTSSDRSLAVTWAEARQKELLGLLKATTKMPDEPACVKESATLPLSAEDWTAPEPVRVGAEGVLAIQDAARG